MVFQFLSLGVAEGEELYFNILSQDFDPIRDGTRSHVSGCYRQTNTRTAADYVNEPAQRHGAHDPMTTPQAHGGAASAGLLCTVKSVLSVAGRAVGNVMVRFSGF